MGDIDKLPPWPMLYTALLFRKGISVGGHVPNVCSLTAWFAVEQISLPVDAEALNKLQAAVEMVLGRKLSAERFYTLCERRYQGELSGTDLRLTFKDDQLASEGGCIVSQLHLMGLLPKVHWGSILWIRAARSDDWMFADDSAANELLGFQKRYGRRESAGRLPLFWFRGAPFSQEAAYVIPGEGAERLSLVGPSDPALTPVHPLEFARIDRRLSLRLLLDPTPSGIPGKPPRDRVKVARV